jgi:hypothetical protein
MKSKRTSPGNPTAMIDRPTDADIEDRRNPYSAPAVDFSDPWRDGPPDALALRRVHRREESLVKGLAISNFLYMLFFGTGAVYEFSILIGHLAGRVDAPWIVRPGWIVSLVLTAFLPIAALGAALRFPTAKALGALVRTGVRRMLVWALGDRTAHQVRSAACARVHRPDRWAPHAGRADAERLVPPALTCLWC